MWTIATNVLSAAATHLLNPPDKSQNGKSGGNYNIRGHINNLPVDLEVESTGHSSGGSRFPHGHQGYPRPLSGTSEIVPLSRKPASCQSCNNSSSSANTNKGGFTKKPNTNKHCKIVIPQDGNYEINIRKFESNFAEMSVSKSTQNFQKGGPNTFRQKGKQQNVNQNQQQKGNQSQQNFQGNNGTQNKPYDNQNKPRGNQNKPNRNQSMMAKPQNERQVKYQNQPSIQYKNQMKIKNHKPGELKFNSGGKNNGLLVHHDQSMSSNCRGTWMYLGRLKVGTTEFEIENYLQQKFPGHTFTVVTLPLYKDAKLPCFKVKVGDRIFEEFRKLEHWPKGVKISKYIES